MSRNPNPKWFLGTYVEGTSDDDHQTTSNDTTKKAQSHLNNQGESMKLLNNDSLRTISGSQKENHSAEGKPTVVLVGDSMVKNINSCKLKTFKKMC